MNINANVTQLAVLFLLLISCATSSSKTIPQEELSSWGTIESIVPQWRFFSPDNNKNMLACLKGKVTNPRIEFRALRIDLQAPDLLIIVKGGAYGSNGTLSSRVSSFVRENGLLAGINAVPFDIASAEEGRPITNVGVVISDYELISPAVSRYDALVWYSDNSVSIVNQSQISGAGNIKNAVGGFHQILKAASLTERVINRDARHPRSAAGISADRRYLYLLVIDGHRIASVGSTEAETALLLKALGCYDGINLDGGGSSALALRYPDGKVRVINTPVHNGVAGRERAVAGCLGIGLNPSTEK